MTWKEIYQFHDGLENGNSSFFFPLGELTGVAIPLRPMICLRCHALSPRSLVSTRFEFLTVY
jgi:hypothetical protein